MTISIERAKMIESVLCFAYFAYGEPTIPSVKLIFKKRAISLSLDVCMSHRVMRSTLIQLTYFLYSDKLAPVKLNRYKDDVLFYMFYTNVGDVLQLAAAAEL